MVGEKLMNSAGQCLLGAFWDVLRMFPTPKDCFGLSIAGSWEGGCGAQRDGGCPARTSPWWWGLWEKNWQSLRDSDQDHPRPSKTFLGCVHSDLLSQRHCETLLVMIAFALRKARWLCSLCEAVRFNFCLLFRAEGLPKPFGWSKTREACWGLFFWWHRKGKRLELRIKIPQVLPSIVDSAVPLA
jgi:hypothetical protein